MSKTFAETLAEDRRLVVLLSLSEATGSHLNDSMLRKLMAFVGHSVGTDQVRADVAWLAAAGLVRVEKIHVASGELWIVHLTGSGEEVVEGRQHSGVAKRRAG